MDGDGSGVASQRWTAYDGANPYADFDSEGSLITRYLYGPGMDQLYARILANGDVDWYLGDILGSVRQIVNSEGTLLDEIAYDSFGEFLNETNPENGDRFKFTSREWDNGTAQYYVRARYYGADIGRFTQEDPSGFGGGDSNLYRYTENNPISRTDPTGLSWYNPLSWGAGGGQYDETAGERWRQNNGLPPIGPPTRVGWNLLGMSAPRPGGTPWVRVTVGGARTALGVTGMALGVVGVCTGNPLGYFAILAGFTEVRNGVGMLMGQNNPGHQSPVATVLIAQGVPPLEANTIATALGIAGIPRNPPPVVPRPGGGAPGRSPGSLPQPGSLEEAIQMRDSFKQMLDQAARRQEVEVWGFALDGWTYWSQMVRRLGGQ